MTPSSVAVTSRSVFAIAVPAMLANVTTPMLGVVATAAIGRLGDAAILGGVAMASLVFDCVFWLFGFLRMGTVALTAQALGADDRPEQRAVLARALAMAFGIGIVLIAAQPLLSRVVFGALGGSATVTDAAMHYFAIRLISAPFALGNYVMLGWLVGLAYPMRALALQIAINVINMVLTAVFMLALGYGVAGAASAAVIAEACGLAAGLIVAWRMLDRRIGLALSDFLDRVKLTRMLSINRDILIRTAALIAAYLFFSARGARAGDTMLAANAVLHNFTLVGSFFLDGMANAAEQLCGRAYGARARTAFTHAVRLVVFWGFAFGLATTLAFIAFGALLIDLMTASDAVRAAARDYLWLAVLVPACGAMAFCFDGIYIGATWARDMRNLMLASFAIYLAVWAAAQPLGNTGLWIALLAFFVVRGGLQAARYPALLRKTFA